MNTVKIEPFDHQLRAVQPNLKRTMYPVVVGFVSEYSEHSREQIVGSSLAMTEILLYLF